MRLQGVPGIDLARRGRPTRSSAVALGLSLAAGTLLSSAVASGATPTLSSSPSDLANVRGTLYFAADDGISGRELWRSDGTEAGTRLVKDINRYAIP